jgi:ribosomal protein S27AE
MRPTKEVGMDERSDEQLKGDSQTSDHAGPEVRGDPSDDTEGVLTLVCFKCGSEYFFSDEAPDPNLTCGKCGNTVFRTYYTHEEGDEADEEFRAETERDLDPDDAEGDALPGDLLDLDDIRA